MNTSPSLKLFLKLLTALLAVSFSLPACTFDFSTIAETEAPSIPGTEATRVSSPDGSPNISLDTSSLATGFQVERIAAADPAEGSPFWQKLPEHAVLTLEGFPIRDHIFEAKIYIYPLEELEMLNDGAAQITASLKSLLESPQELPTMPFLPLINQTQVMHAHVQTLNFRNGQGMRYLTEYSQGIVPINNQELIYTYQGLTSDGKYYVAAVLPVNHPSLPAAGTVTGNQAPEFASDYLSYLANMANEINSQAANTFTPDLTQLDNMMTSLEIH